MDFDNFRWLLSMLWISEDLSTSSVIYKFDLVDFQQNFYARSIQSRLRLLCISNLES